MAAPARTGDADLASVGAIIAEPARAKILLALLDGRALPASMLASEAGVAASTTSHHLGRLVDGGLVRCQIRGRYRYYALATPAVADMLETLARLAPAQPVTSLRQGSRAHAIRYARSCYDHLAGRLGVALTDALSEHDLITSIDAAGANRPARTGARPAQPMALTAKGVERLGRLGMTAAAGELGRGCMDWTEQRAHLGGTLGRQLLTLLLDRNWVARRPSTRAMQLTALGRAELPDAFGLRIPDSAA